MTPAIMARVRAAELCRAIVEQAKVVQAARAAVDSALDRLDELEVELACAQREISAIDAILLASGHGIV